MTVSLAAFSCIHVSVGESDKTVILIMSESERMRESEGKSESESVHVHFNVCISDGMSDCVRVLIYW